MTTSVKWGFCLLVRAARIELAQYAVPEQEASHQSPNLARLSVPPCPHSFRWRMDGPQGRPLANEFLLKQVLLFALLSFWGNFKEAFPAPLHDVALVPQPCHICDCARAIRKYSRQTRSAPLLPACRLLPANILTHFSKSGLSGKCYSFPVGFFFWKARALPPAKILSVRQVGKCEKKNRSRVK